MLTRIVRMSVAPVLAAAALLPSAPRAESQQPPVAAPLTIPAAEFTARRAALAMRIENGVVVAFGGRALVHDFGTFFQLPTFHYLTDYDEPDGAFVQQEKVEKTSK